jgi:hypothetical protein
VDQATRTEEVVVGSLFSSNSSLQLPSSLLRPKMSPVVEESTAFASIHGSLKNVNNPSPEVNETTPLMMPCDEHYRIEHNNEKYVKRNCNMKRLTLYCCMGTVSILLVLLTLTVTLVYENKQLNNSGNTAVLQNENDTILAVKTSATRTSKLSLQLTLHERQPLHVVNIYSNRCKNLKTHSSVLNSSGTFSVHRAVAILSPTYLVSGSVLHINSYVLNASVITAQIELYVFRGLSDLETYGSNLQDSVYKATVYIQGSGVQNTSTFVNFTAPTTDYYFLVVDSTASIYAQFDININRKYYDPADYKQSCEIHDSDVCDLSYHTSFKDRQECVLAHAVYVPGAQWLPAEIQITEEPQRFRKTAVIVMSCVGGSSVLSLFTITFCGFFVCVRDHKGSS